MNRKLTFYLTVLATAFFYTAAFAETNPNLARQKLLEWIDVKKTISAEKADWYAEKIQLNDLNRIREKEIEKLDQLLSRSKIMRRENGARITKQLNEADKLEAQRKNLALRIDELEEQLEPLIAKLPPPLTAKLKAETANLGRPERPLQDRYRDLTLILIEIGNFNSTITLDTEIRETGDGRAEVDILYLGLAQAWYVTRSGSSAGYGAPTSKGWKWTEEQALAGEIRKAIAIADKQTPPGFTALTLYPEGK